MSLKPGREGAGAARGTSTTGVRGVPGGTGIDDVGMVSVEAVGVCAVDVEGAGGVGAVTVEIAGVGVVSVETSGD
jgi:hypothetical protein